MSRRVVILGAGPAGLAAGYRLRELGHEDFEILEARATAGGLASSETSENGFVYDIGGHVLFSHFTYFDELFDRMLGDEYQELERESWIWIMDRFLPYPFQNNIKYLPKEAVLECVLGLIRAAKESKTAYRTFEELIHGVFGEGIARHFMMPYNFKVWAHPPAMLGTRWIGERVPVVDIERVLGNVILDRDDVSWGPNNTFKYPRHGGTGGLFARIAATLEGKIRYGSAVIAVDARRRRVTLDTGRDVEYDDLISTIPLDRLVEGIADAPDDVRSAAGDLLHSGSAIVGVGVRQPCPSKKCWMYFPEASSPFYRVTYLSNYSPEVVPDARTHYSLLAEVSRSPFKPVNLDTIVEEVLDGMVATRLLSPDDLRDVADTHLIVRDYTYPIPSIDRDRALSIIQPWLEARRIHSRGRFGSWKYEIGNMDHAVQMGAECADRLVLGRPELCLHDRIPPKAEQTLHLVAEEEPAGAAAAREELVAASAEG